ncbi:MAG: TatD family hydrolase [Bacteroidota bacterium]
MKIIDTHSHLYSEKFSEDLDSVIERAAAITEAVFLPNIDNRSIQSMHSLVAKKPELFYPMMGLHPCSVEENFEPTLENMEKRFHQFSYYGVGETGLDLYWDKTSLPRQITSLKVHIQWAKAFQLPIILHARNAIDEVFSCIAEAHSEDLWGIFHCFDGSLTQAQKICELGNFKLGIGGNLTYRKDVPKVVREVPLEFIVLETDSPYLAPEPHRRTRNESSYTRFVAEKLGELFDLPYEEIARITNRNAKEVFRTYERVEKPEG